MEIERYGRFGNISRYLTAIKTDGLKPRAELHVDILYFSFYYYDYAVYCPHDEGRPKTDTSCTLT